jgi:hypothetical protein
MLGCLPLSCNFEDRGQVPGNAVGFTDFQWGTFQLAELFECEVIEEHVVLHKLNPAATLIQRTTTETPR